MKILKLLIFCLSVTVLIVQPALVTAQADGEDVNRAYEGLVWAPDGLEAGCFIDSALNTQTAWNHFINSGFTEEQTAGIIGNLLHESGLDPTIKQGGGTITDPYNTSGKPARGIAQWEIHSDGSGRWWNLLSYAEALQRNPLELGLQLDFIMFEMTGQPPADGASGGATESGAYSRLIETSSVEEAAVSFARYYERNALSIDFGKGLVSYEDAFRVRIDAAEGAYNDFAGTAVPSVSGQTCATLIEGLSCPTNLEQHSVHEEYFKMPDAPNGEYTIYSSQTRRYGSKNLVCALYTVGMAYKQIYGGQSTFRIGDLNAAGHATHNVGIANDNDASGELNAGDYVNNPSNYSTEATIQLGKLFVDTGILQNIWWCEPGAHHNDLSGNDGSMNAIRDYANSRGFEINIKCIDSSDNGRIDHANHFHVDILDEFAGPFHEP